MYFPDLSPYTYGIRSNRGMVNVGWLDGFHEFPKGKAPEHLVEKMKALARKPTQCYRGSHVCELCPVPASLTMTGLTTTVAANEWWDWAKLRAGNGEIRVKQGRLTYSAPVLIVHYIQEHNYLPPEDFLRALEGETTKRSGWWQWLTQLF